MNENSSISRTLSHSFSHRNIAYFCFCLFYIFLYNTVCFIVLMQIAFFLSLSPNQRYSSLKQFFLVGAILFIRSFIRLFIYIFRSFFCLFVRRFALTLFLGYWFLCTLWYIQVKANAKAWALLKIKYRSEDAGHFWSLCVLILSMPRIWFSFENMTNANDINEFAFFALVFFLLLLCHRNFTSSRRQQMKDEIGWLLYVCVHLQFGGIAEISCCIPKRLGLVDS